MPQSTRSLYQLLSDDRANRRRLGEAMVDDWKKTLAKTRLHCPLVVEAVRQKHEEILGTPMQGDYLVRFHPTRKGNMDPSVVDEADTFRIFYKTDDVAPRSLEVDRLCGEAQEMILHILHFPDAQSFMSNHAPASGSGRGARASWSYQDEYAAVYNAPQRFALDQARYTWGQTYAVPTGVTTATVRYDENGRLVVETQNGVERADG